jgi:PTS system beta-glucosides-specific IIC component
MLGFKKKDITIVSPMIGTVVSVAHISDPVFNENVLGRGIAIKPVAGFVCAPAKAIVSQMFETGHAVNLLTDSGVELLIHVGIDTVKLKGRHYTILKKNNENVKTGDILIKFDAAAISAEGFETITPIVVCNPDAFSEIIFAPEGPIITGDPLITIKI